MASSANPNLWPDLTGLGLSDTNGTDARAALLKVNAEMFVAAPAHDRESIETFETLVLGFLPRTDRATLLDLARILAPCEDTPASILDYLVRQAPEIQDILLRHTTRLPVPHDSRLLASPEQRLQLASRAELDAATIERLLVLHESATENALAANPALPSSTPAFKKLVRRAQTRPALARILLEREDLTVADESALYLAADHEHRRRIREHVTTSLVHQRATLSFKLTEHDVSEFFATCLQGDVGRFEALLNGAFGFPATTDWRVLEIGRHHLLALALKALGLVEKEATRIFLTLHPALSYPLSAIKELVREVRDVPSPVALALVEAILDVRALSERPHAL
jgi:hypothetical protein